MSLYQGYSHSEIAERLDMPLGTVKTRVRRGLIHVREQLKIAEECEDPIDSAEEAGT
jgi:RNA polymerase sigma-70 factor (ECF subfamily)